MDVGPAGERCFVNFSLSEPGVARKEITGDFSVAHGLDELAWEEGCELRWDVHILTGLGVVLY